MSYSPKNTAVYLAAQAGALAGFYSGQYVTAAPNYAVLADEWGQAVDTAWGSGSYTLLDLQEITACSMAQWTDQGSAPQSTFANLAAGLVTLVKDGTAQVVAEGINPNAGSGGSGAQIISVAAKSNLSAQPVVSSPQGTQAYVQASGGSYWSWFPTGTTIPAGAQTQAGNGGTWVFSALGTTTTPATVVAASYTAQNTDGTIRTSSVGGQPTVLLPAIPFLGERHIVVAAFYDINQTPTIVSGNGNTLAPASGLGYSGGYLPTTQLQAGTSNAWVWDGTYWNAD